MNKSLGSDLENSFAQEQVITLGSADYVVPESMLRMACIIMPADGNQLQVRLGITNSSIGGFISILPGDVPLCLPLSLYGDLIRREFVITGTVGDTFIFIETLREPRS